MCILTLKNRKFGKKIVLLDKEDYDNLKDYKWFYFKSRNKFYVITHINKKTYYMHRVILGTPINMETDHRNGDGLDNRKSNLRIANQILNQMNRGKQKNNKSGYKGVSWDKKLQKWTAQIKLNKKVIHLGSFISPLEASQAYTKIYNDAMRVITISTAEVVGQAISANLNA